MDRINDTETKMLGQLDKGLEKMMEKHKIENGKDIYPENIKGELELFTFNEPCENCFSVINQFSSKYPNIKIKIKFVDDYTFLR